MHGSVVVVVTVPIQLVSIRTSDARYYQAEGDSAGALIHELSGSAPVDWFQTRL